ncbi:MAG: DUF4363 family protein [Ruminococcaceae bacterium]|nr:DUF4363 family protein [Oscillospiraceae bacterium]
MKGLVMAAVILTLLVGLVAWNAAFVRRTAEELLDELTSLPEEPTGEQTARQVAAIRMGLEAKLPALSLTVQYPVLDRVTEALEILELQAQKGGEAYAETRSLALEYVKEIARLETPSLRNIL